MKIAVDLDEVLGELLSPVLVYYNQRFNKNLDINQFHCYNFWEVWGGTKQEAIQIVNDFFTEGHSENIKPIPGAQQAINILKNKRNLIIVTSRGDNLRAYTEKWINKSYPKSFSEIYFSNDFSANNGNVKKSEICKKLGVNLIIEDNLHYALDCSKEGIISILLDKPWNKQSENYERVFRVNNWDDILHLMPKKVI
ncbi:MAG: hypothetical protein PHD81_01755 [Candidatus Nanoarchaeia archaeon]|nr:hypothetical protein [Candidatus Nanoarchaeia archaeon]MDD5587814.1 hypothetical protein [Candidatus Nanoarchaeia archaeon]